jgi:UDP-glucose 4-epimerase
MNTYLVTGGCGFIGSHLADALVARGDRVRILDDLSTGKRENAPRQAEVIVGDVRDPAMVADGFEGVDGCFHLAAIASVVRCNEDWAGTHAVNLTGAIHVFDAARAGATPVVYASSAAAYGDNPAVPLAEDAVCRPISAYGADKLGCELHGRVAALVHGVPTTGLRFFNVFGPRQDPGSPYSGVISIFADRIVGRRELTIFGDGLQVRDFIYVGDVVKALIAAMDRKMSVTADVFNVCTGRQTSVLDLAKTMGRVHGNEPRIVFAPARTGDIRVSVGSSAKADAALGFGGRTALHDGLAATLTWLATG